MTLKIGVYNRDGSQCTDLFQNGNSQSVSLYLCIILFAVGLLNSIQTRYQNLLCATRIFAQKMLASALVNYQTRFSLRWGSCAPLLVSSVMQNDHLQSGNRKEILIAERWWEPHCGQQRAGSSVCERLLKQITSERRSAAKVDSVCWQKANMTGKSESSTCILCSPNLLFFPSRPFLPEAFWTWAQLLLISGKHAMYSKKIVNDLCTVSFNAEAMHIYYIVT